MDNEINEIILNLKNLLSDAVKDAIGNSKKAGVVFSAGIDSTIIVMLANKFCDVVTYTVGMSESEDVVFAQKFKDLNLMNTKIILITENDVKNEIEHIIKILDDNIIPVTKLNLSTAIPIYFASKKAKEDNVELMLSGQGSDEIFGGYARYLRMDIDERIHNMERDIKNAYNDNLNRDVTMCTFNKVTLKFPYLDKNFSDYARNIPMKFKIYEIEGDELNEFAETFDIVEGKKFIRKFILRKLGKEADVPEFIVKRRKKAMQYGSRSEKMIEKI
ncbi:MAG: asparagine synthase-related protein [Candidatus Altarchaeum sp.]|nr:asparagine synthase-related protein [Candidatus Altarchaeum sp.]